MILRRIHTEADESETGILRRGKINLKKIAAAFSSQIEIFHRYSRGGALLSGIFSTYV
jgi:hypothetical protein